MLESEVASVLGWDSVAARGMWWGRIMAGRVSKSCQRSCWGRQSSHRLGGCLLCIQRRCRSVLYYLNVLLCFAVVVFAWCCG